MKTIKIAHGQTIEDIALQHYGAIEGLSMLMEDNGLSLDDLLVPGAELIIQDEADLLTDRASTVMTFYKINGLAPNTGMAGVAHPEYVVELYWEDNYTEND